MANDFIPITIPSGDGQSQAQLLKTFCVSLSSVYGQAVALRDKMTHMNNPPDWTVLETKFGVPSGQGQAVFDLMNGAVQAMQGTSTNSNIKTITEKMG